MMRLLALFALTPASALAHGGHAHVDGPLHGAVHAGPAMLFGVLALVIACWVLRGRS